MRFPHPVLLVAPDGVIESANMAAEIFMRSSASVLRRHPDQ